MAVSAGQAVTHHPARMCRCAHITLSASYLAQAGPEKAGLYCIKNIQIKTFALPSLGSVERALVRTCRKHMAVEGFE